MNKPAFPKGACEEDAPQTGMSLLEYYTGQALPSVLSDITCYHNPEKAAAHCVEFAEAIITELEKRYK